jgi:hypothetical protein
MPVTFESRFAVAERHRLTGKRYPRLEAAFEALEPDALRELVRLCHDLDQAVREAERKGARDPWRRGR